MVKTLSEVTQLISSRPWPSLPAYALDHRAVQLPPNFRRHVRNPRMETPGLAQAGLEGEGEPLGAAQVHLRTFPIHFAGNSRVAWEMGPARVLTLAASHLLSFRTRGRFSHERKEAQPVGYQE